MSAMLELVALEKIPDCAPGDDLLGMIVDALAKQSLTLRDGDVLVVAQKVVSKVEGRYVTLASVSPSSKALELAEATGKDPRLVELILRESTEVLRIRPGVIVVEHRNGYVHANAGIDQSNIPQEDSQPQVLLLPEDSNRSAALLKRGLMQHSKATVGVVISDSAGRAWRNGTIGLALGSAGITVLQNRNGEADMYGRTLQATEIAIADQIAAAATLLMGEAAERLPVVVVRGGNFLAAVDDDRGCEVLIRDKTRDMFR
ncbi:MAG: coenzyme F420-0:L-glutamate ligase [Congregibacter sp.]